ncbi:ABC transporter ATP-binding protein [Macrococcoides canis]|uniref:ABC transporter ATP-binding protein n=1 Tax=Macrococcoides canis TaxID=1855823 RepID=UPI0020B89B6E|nr:ABC transporter ATP-binding protein [Macrococcus canis]UTH06713.1 ABC transporter ATP-binding protein [Macrococcus canis]
MSVLYMDKVSKVYDNHMVVDELNIQINKGEIYGLLGPSGSGKTTTIRMLTGETRPNEGDIEVMSFKNEQLFSSHYKKRIGILSDNSALYERLSIYDNLRVYTDLYNVHPSRIKEVLTFVDLEGESKTIVKNLSKGMKQRILLAKCLIHKPDFLFLDEPTSALDPHTTAHIHAGLMKLKSEGVTIFLTTHDMEEAEKLCDRISLIHNGKLIETDTPQALRYRYSNHTVVVEMISGEIVNLELIPENAEQMSVLMKSGKIKRINTNELSLSEVFILLTGKELI